ncbi:4'-phosphopantetheinyl transferase family protein [Fluviispira multicolorata]|uniref:4'-phosphopantetheinyl transferase superfamily protein n=1 Tax=Fluviispira multicolorata TaxID=2654512 RepID=A0A833JDC7_9BACT|nr:4'-phosphopantetheinyl transferase superfamily protein [Fluviispira multicolorata]KAB8031077.1 4'-phosphopantetheinyl transferase superfamily protein [Fluviispira multicolorata]
MSSWLLIKNKNIFLKKSDIHLWRVRLSQEERLLQNLTKFLTYEEVEKANKFYKNIDKIRYIFARSILKLLISNYLSLDAKNIHFSYSKYFKPFLAINKNLLNLKFNMTHAGNWISYAFTLEDEIGIDIEEYKNDFDMTGSAKLVFSPEEFCLWQELPENEKCASFFHIWSCKEAIMKAIGLGFHYPPEKITVSINPFIPCSFIEDKNCNHNLSDWTLEKFNIDNNYSAAFAIKKKNINLSLFEWDFY